MKLKMLVSLSGPAICLSPGDEHDFSQDEAAALIEAGYAVPVVPDKIERAIARKPAEQRSA
ncbi:hypothetical protein IQ35_00665 [Sphingobium wenxiniae]|uniref:Uncharacterized protein n=2 Tax=Sphingobium wenxiniae (strain DSM 21828 / CGMCC 1.7748 / JZ-1) TaxID=595605 RepID=A0A562KMY2_SPHWJ|nr:hypothetical protein IQ35_00665 [Sphingobium wenxiniae]